MSKRNSSKRIIEYNRRHITQTALDLFCKKGILRTTVEEIADAGDISKVTVYHYFPTKTDIVLSVTDEILKNYMSSDGQLAVFSADFENLTGLDQIKSLLDIYLDFSGHNVDYLIFICEMEIYVRINKLTQTQQKTLRLHQKALTSFLKNALFKGLQDQSIKITCAPESLFGIFYGPLRGMCLNLFFARESGKKSELKQAVQDLEIMIGCILRVLSGEHNISTLLPEA